MKNKKLLVFLLLLFAFFYVYSAEDDSLVFFNEVKEFVVKQTGKELEGDLYTKWSKGKDPYLYVYVSLPDKVETPSELNSAFIYCGTDKEKAEKNQKEYAAKGYDVFCYKAYANSATVLNDRLVSYRKETQCFIVLHELMHNYLSQEKIKIPYDFNEALSDVIGNYGTLGYAQFTSKLDFAVAQRQAKLNEKIYLRLNSSIAQIEKHPEKTKKINATCRNKIVKLLKDADAFQRDRFDYEVNNAYLLKNKYYCKNYFLLKRVFLQARSIKDFLEIIRNVPGKSADCKVYLEKYD